MPQAEEEIIISAIDIAEQIALIEARLERLKKKPGEEWLIHTSQKMLAYFRDRAAENDLAEQFLPQARIIVPLKKTRRRFIKSNTLLGRCKSRLDDIIRSQELKDKDWELRSPEELMEFLMDGILLGDPRKVAPRLSDVFEEIVEDLVRRPRDKELPPLPPNYDLTPISFDKHKMEVAASIQSFAQGTGATFSAHVESSLPLVMEDPVAIGPTVDELRPFLEPKMALSASAAFGIIAEILKLIPSDCHLGVRITTPCSGQYYCLSLIREHHSIADFNLGTGRLHVHEGSFVVGKDWPQPLSYLLAAGGRESGIDQISREVVASLGIEPKKESSSFDGAGYRTLSILLARFAYGMVSRSRTATDKGTGSQTGSVTPQTTGLINLVTTTHLGSTGASGVNLPRDPSSSMMKSPCLLEPPTMSASTGTRVRQLIGSSVFCAWKMASPQTISAINARMFSYDHMYSAARRMRARQSSRPRTAIVLNSGGAFLPPQVSWPGTRFQAAAFADRDGLSH